MGLKKEWLDYCLDLACEKETLYSGCRKIIRGKVLEFSGIDDTLHMKDAGFTVAKMRQLQRNYHVETSLVAVHTLWKQRAEKAKYGSVGFHCYNHLVKSDANWDGKSEAKKSSKRASVMGPCIQAVNLTWIKKGVVGIDLYYRTTELFKKFPADLVFLRDDLLPRFNLRKTKLEVRCYFANITLHPMYFVTIMGSLNDPLQALERIKKKDKYFHDWIVKWTGRYLCPEHHRGIAKFAQALRVQSHAHEMFKGSDLKRIQSYLRNNHPGYKNDYEDEDEDNA